MPNSVPTNQNDERLKDQNRALLLLGHFEGYSANSNLISRTRVTSGMQNHKPIISQKLSHNMTTTTTFEGWLLKKEDRDIDSNLEDLLEDQIN